MNFLLGALILLGVPFACLAAGAWLGARIERTSAAQRVAISLLAGLAVNLLLISILSLFGPLAGWRLSGLLVPLLPALARPGPLGQLIRDSVALLRHRTGILIVSGALVFLAALLWPLLAHPALRFYDGTANHDAFFWIAGADHLQRHDCLTPLSADTPTGTRSAGYLLGWQPEWGRMGAEGYLATIASLTGQRAISIYLWSSAALYSFWLAAVYLVARRFVIDAVRWPAALSLGALQPLFAFYHHNANLPNLLGMLCGATLLLALDRGLLTNPEQKIERRSWTGLAVVALHGVLVSYPEIAPFVLLPGGLLVLRAALAAADRRVAFVFAGSVLLLGVALNPATALRAGHGLVIAFSSAQANELRPDFLAKLSPSESLPALLTLSVKTGQELGAVGGTIVTAGLALAAALAIFRARDRIGLGLALAGGAALLLYTLATGFSYGWQKCAQFSAVFIAAVLPVGAVQLLAYPRGQTRIWLGRVAAAGVALFFIFALTIVQLDLAKWSARKALSADDLALASQLSGVAPTARVAVVSATFAQPFFTDMWIANLLPTRLVHYVTAEAGHGGYLRGWVKEVSYPQPDDLLVVNRVWADRIYPDTPRIAQTDHFVVLAAEVVPATLLPLR